MADMLGAPEQAGASPSIATARTGGPEFDIDKAIRVRIIRLGAEGQPVLVVDRVLADPQRVVDHAAAADFYAPPHTHYPGLNAHVPEGYYRTVIAALRQPLEAAFGLSMRARLDYFGFLGLSTQAAADATPAQRFPHVDSYDPNRLAMVHYFCDETHGGTGFFRQKATGYECVDQGRARRYVAEVMVERSRSEGLAPAFPHAGMPHYDLIGQSDAVFNRLVVYRSHIFHAPLLGAGGAAADPRSGRLTANGFITPVSV